MLGKGGGEWSHVASEETGGEKEEGGRMAGCWGISSACFFSSFSFRERFWLGKKEKERGGFPSSKKKKRGGNERLSDEEEFARLLKFLLLKSTKIYTLLPGMS